MWGEKIGSGSMAIIYAKDRVVSKQYENLEEELPSISFKEEVESLKRLVGCPWVVQYVSHDNLSGTIRMEQLAGDVKSLMRLEYKYPRENWAWQFTVDLLRAEDAMFKAKVLHGDLNFNNILYYVKEDKSLGFKVCDFSHCSLISESISHTHPYPFFGGPEWLRFRSVCYDLEKVAIWTIGILIYYLHTDNLLVSVMWKSSKYFDSDAKFMTSKYNTLLGNFIQDIDQFRQVDIVNLITDMKELLPVEQHELIQELLLFILVIDLDKRYTPAQALKLLGVHEENQD